MALGTTVGTLLDRVRRDAMLGLYGPIYTLASGVGANATSLEVAQSVEHVAVGSVLAVDTELYLVTGHTGTTITVVPGFHGSSSAAHATGAVVEVDPRVPKAALLDYVDHEIRSWGRQLFQVVTEETTLSLTEKLYELVDATDPFFLLDVRRAPDSGSIWTPDTWPKVEAQLLRALPPEDVASGYAIQLLNYPTAAVALRVVYGQAFDTTTLDAGTDLVEDVGLRVSYLEIVEAGVKYRALADGVFARTDYRSSGMSRNAEEVTTLDLIRASDLARSRRDMVLADRALELRGEWPYPG